MYDFDDPELKFRVGWLISKKRAQKELTHEQVANLIGCRRQNLSDWERGDSYPRKYIHKLQEYLDISDSELVAAFRGETPSAEAWHKISGEFLPDPPQPFVGHEAALKFVKTFILQSKTKSLLLHGMGGIGKTSLIAKAFSDLGQSARPLCFFLAIHGFEEISDPDAQLRAALTRLIYQFGDYEGQLPVELVDVKALWKHISRSVDRIIVLDNVTTTDQLEALKPLGDTRWIATSRIKLTGAETSYQTDILDEDEAESLAAELFAGKIDIAPSISKRLALLCDRLPLAIHVAAEAIICSPNLNLEHFLEELSRSQKRFSLSDSWEPAVMDRLRISVDQLSVDQQMIWASLGLFTGSFGEDAAKSLFPAEDMFAHLANFVRRHLIVQHEVGPDDVIRFSLHDLLRAVALRSLEQSRRETILHTKRAFANFYATLLNTAATIPRNSVDKFAIRRRILFEIDNIRSAFEFSLDDAEDIEAIERILSLIRSGDLQQQFPVQERLAWLEKANAALTGNLNYLGNDRFYSLRSDLTLAQCEMHVELGHFENAETILRRALNDERLVSTTDRPDLLYTALGKVLRRIPDRTEEAGEAYRKAHALMSERDIPIGEQSAFLHSYANFCFQLGDLDEAAQAHQRAVDLDVSIDDLEGVAVGLGNLANISMQRGEYKTAEDQIEKAITIERSRNLSHSLNQSLQIRALIAFVQNKIDEAVPFYTEALELSRENGQTVLETKALGALATCALRAKQSMEARDLARQAIRNAYDNDHFPLSAGAMRTMALANMNLLKVRSAARVMRCAFDIHTKANQWLEITQDLLVLAEIKFTVGETDEARHLAEEAQNLATQMDQKFLAEGARWLIEKIDSADMEAE